MEAPAVPWAQQSQSYRFNVEGCCHAIVGGIIRGEYVHIGYHHTKPLFMKMTCPTERQVFVYFWSDEADLGFSGWWFGPQVGVDIVWAKCASSAELPPTTGWQVPYNGAVDTTMHLIPGITKVQSQLAQHKSDLCQQPVSQQYEHEGANALCGRRSNSDPSSTHMGYVEWRRLMPSDHQTGATASVDSFLQFCAEIGLYNAEDKSSIVVEDDCKCELSLRLTEFKESLLF